MRGEGGHGGGGGGVLGWCTFSLEIPLAAFCARQGCRMEGGRQLSDHCLRAAAGQSRTFVRGAEGTELDSTVLYTVDYPTSMHRSAGANWCVCREQLSQHNSVKCTSHKLIEKAL